VREYHENRKHMIEAEYKTIYTRIHRVEVDNVGDLQKAISDSEFDYEVEGRILEAKRKAASKIIKWWKIKRQEIREKRKAGTYAPLPSETVKDLRLIQELHADRNVLEEVKLLLSIEKSKDELVSFLLTNSLSSSLDFHFVLMTLNRISECREHYLQYCAWDPSEIHEFDLPEVQE
jgi:hypothetical protein